MLESSPLARLRHALRRARPDRSADPRTPDPAQATDRPERAAGASRASDGTADGPAEVTADGAARSAEAAVTSARAPQITPVAEMPLFTRHATPGFIPGRVRKRGPVDAPADAREDASSDAAGDTNDGPVGRGRAPEDNRTLTLSPRLLRASRLNLSYIPPSSDRRSVDAHNGAHDGVHNGGGQKVWSMSGSEFFAQHFGLKERPFTLLPDPDFLFWSAAHKRAYAVLEYGVMSRAPITIVTGEVGAGKTTLLQKLMQNFDKDTVVGLISNAQGGRGELLQWVLNALDVPSDLDAPYVTKFQQLQDFVIEKYAAGQRVVLVIDEAQNLSVEGLEELRMLTNINSNKDELLQLILVGQPELREMITRQNLRQFAQRVSASFHLPAMDAETTAQYIQHRLRHAGGTGEEFTPEAIALIHHHASGVPRLVNKLSDFGMVYAVTSDKSCIDAATIEDVMNDNIFLQTEDPTKEAAE